MKTVKPLSAMTASELRESRARADAERSAVNDAMIAAGRGHERTLETLAKAKLPAADPLTLRFAASCAACGAIHDEEDRRMVWHGSLDRIRTDSPLARSFARPS